MGVENLQRMRKAMRRSRQILILCGVLGLFSAAFSLWALQAQVSNSVRIVQITIGLSKYRQANGRYPDQLSEVDYWGAPVYYVHSKDRFVVASFGLGARPDEVTYLPLLAQNLPPKRRICFWPWADTVFTDRGPVTYCLA